MADESKGPEPGPALPCALSTVARLNTVNFEGGVRRPLLLLPGIKAERKKQPAFAYTSAETRQGLSCIFPADYPYWRMVTQDRQKGLDGKFMKGRENRDQYPGDTLIAKGDRPRTTADDAYAVVEGYLRDDAEGRQFDIYAKYRPLVPCGPLHTWPGLHDSPLLGIYPEGNNLTVIDIDNYKTDPADIITDAELFIKKWGDPERDSDRAWYRTRRVSTPSGGFHVYYQYEPELGHHQLGCLDIQGDNAVVVAPGTEMPELVTKEGKVKPGGWYTIISKMRHSVIKMPEEMKAFLLEMIAAKKKAPSQRKVGVRAPGQTAISAFARQEEWAKLSEARGLPLSTLPTHEEEATLKEVVQTVEVWDGETMDLVVASQKTYHFSPGDLEKVLTELVQHRPGAWGNYGDWRLVTAMMKTLWTWEDETCWVKEMWDTFSKENGGTQYDHLKNEGFWDASKIGYGFVHHVVTEWFPVPKEGIDLQSYHRFKPLPPDVVEEPTDTFDRPYLMDRSNSYRFYQPGIDYVVKSTTGTGKTSGFAKYISDLHRAGLPHKYCSVVSRRSLAKAQVKALGESSGAGTVREVDGDPWVSHYEDRKLTGDAQRFGFDKDPHERGNWVIQLDSIRHFHSLCEGFYPDAQLDDWSDRIVLFDEFNSLLEYLLSSDTLADKRVETFRHLRVILQTCKQYIIVDADISGLVFTFLQHVFSRTTFHQNPFQYHVNQHRPYGDKKATELGSYDAVLDKLEEMCDGKWLCACDSVKTANALYQDLTNKGIWVKLYTADEATAEHLDDDRIVFSPSIVYGLDDQVPRPVFAVHRGRSIDPRAMHQQIARCRHMTELFYHFKVSAMLGKGNRQFYLSQEQCTTEYKEQGEFQYWEQKKHPLRQSGRDYGDGDCYNTMMSVFSYRQDCYQTNKFGHFRKMLTEKGFTDCPAWLSRTVRSESSKKQDSHEKAANAQMMQQKIEAVTNRASLLGLGAHVGKRLNYLNVPDPFVPWYADLFVSQEAFDKYQNGIYPFWKKALHEGDTSFDDYVKDRMGEDFAPNRYDHVLQRLVWFRDLVRSVGAADSLKLTRDGDVQMVGTWGPTSKDTAKAFRAWVERDPARMQWTETYPGVPLFGFTYIKPGKTKVIRATCLYLKKEYQHTFTRVDGTSYVVSDKPGAAANGVAEYHNSVTMKAVKLTAEKTHPFVWNEAWTHPDANPPNPSGRKAVQVNPVHLVPMSLETAKPVAKQYKATFMNSQWLNDKGACDRLGRDPTTYTTKAGLVELVHEASKELFGVGILFGTNLAKTAKADPELFVDVMMLHRYVRAFHFGSMKVLQLGDDEDDDPPVSALDEGVGTSSGDDDDE
jgi:hypothetical protein